MRAGTPQIRSALAGAVLACALALPAGADAGSARYDGPAARGDFSVSFKVISEEGRPQKVRKFRFRGVVITCDSGPDPNPFTTKSKKPHFGPFNVSREGRFGRRFTSKTDDFDGIVVIRGEFETRRRAAGILRIEGDYPNGANEDYLGCASGRLEWTARLT